MTHTKHSEPKQRPWYPRYVSDRADVLLGELDEAQCQQLYDALRTTSYSEWMGWLEDKREEIGEYDELTASARKRRLQKTDQTYALRLHHACVFVELWRTRTHEEFYHFPPYGQVPDKPHLQRAMMLAVVAAQTKADIRDYWPFEFPLKAEPFPFRES